MSTKSAAKVTKANKSSPLATDAKITSVVKNPKRPGSKRYARFALYRSGMTVADALKAGLRTKDIKGDAEKKFIKLAK